MFLNFHWPKFTVCTDGFHKDVFFQVYCLTFLICSVILNATDYSLTFIHPYVSIKCFSTNHIKRLLVTFSGILKHLQNLKVNHLDIKVTLWQNPENPPVSYT